MPPTIVPQASRGCIFFGTSDGSGAYTDPKGNAGTPWTLTNANFEASDQFPVGPDDRDLFIDIAAVISVGMASAVIIVEGLVEDRNNPGLFNPFVCGTVRVDKQSNAGATIAPAASQTIARADLAGQSVSLAKAGGGATTEVLDVTLRTTDHRGAAFVRVLVKATNAPQAGDKVAIFASVGK